MSRDWKSQIQSTSLPYPNKREILDEIEEHVLHNPGEAKEIFSEESLNDLYGIHNTKFKQALDKMDPSLGLRIQKFLVLCPLVGLSLFILKERFMLEFLNEGGAGMILILLIGLILLGREAFYFLRLILIKDHSTGSIQVDSFSGIVGSCALVVLGLAVGFLGAYLTLNSVLAHQLGRETLIMGLKESLSPLIVSSTMAALILLIHFSTRRLLLHWKAPLAG